MSGDDARKGVPRAGRTPNRVLRVIRENERRETRAIFASGIEVQQFARKVGVDEKTIQRWISRGPLLIPGIAGRQVSFWGAMSSSAALREGGE